jgi:O-methyltransferase
MPASVALRRARQGLFFARHHRAYRIYRRFSGHSMIPGQQYVENILLAERVIHLPGAIVECGTWRGGMIGGIATAIGSDRDYVLFDSFEGLPAAQEIDGEAATRWQADRESPRYLDNCRAEAGWAQGAMKMAGVDRPEIVPGWFQDTVPQWAADGRRIALLRLDGDWYESTMVCLEHLFGLVVPGGLVVIDDYGVWEGCTKAVHQYLADQGRGEPIRRTRSGVTSIVKR